MEAATSMTRDYATALENFTRQFKEKEKWVSELNPLFKFSVKFSTTILWSWELLVPWSVSWLNGFDLLRTNSNLHDHFFFYRPLELVRFPVLMKKNCTVDDKSNAHEFKDSWMRNLLETSEMKLRKASQRFNNETSDIKSTQLNSLWGSGASGVAEDIKKRTRWVEQRETKRGEAAQRHQRATSNLNAS